MYNMEKEPPLTSGGGGGGGGGSNYSKEAKTSEGECLMGVATAPSNNPRELKKGFTYRCRHSQELSA